MPRTVLVRKHLDLGRAVYARFDDSSEHYELFADKECTDYLGACDTIREAQTFAAHHFNEMMA